MVAGDTRTITCSWQDQPELTPGQPRIESTVQYWNEWLAGGAIPTGAHRGGAGAVGADPQGPHPRADRARPSPPPRRPCPRPPAAAATGTTATPGSGTGCAPSPRSRTWASASEAHAFLGFIADRLDAAPLQVMYGIGGETRAARVDPRPPGGLRGRAARSHRQRRGAPAAARHVGLAGASHRARPGRRVTRPSTTGRGRIVRQMAAEATAHWRLPDRGIWEVRGEPRHFGSSKLMAWVALDRASRIARRRGDQTRGALGRGSRRGPRRPDAATGSTPAACSRRRTARRRSMPPCCWCR